MQVNVRNLLWKILIWGVGLLPLVIVPFWPRSFDKENYVKALQEGFGINRWIARSATIIVLIIATGIIIIVLTSYKVPKWRLPLFRSAVFLGTSYALSSAFGLSPYFSLAHTASILLLIAIIVMPQIRINRFITDLKKVLWLYIIGSAFVAFLIPSWSLEYPYLQAYVTGFYWRLHGLAVHAIQLSTFCWLFLLLELVQPTRELLSRCFKVSLSIIVMILTQSKTMIMLLFLGMLAIKKSDKLNRLQPIALLFVIFVPLSFTLLINDFWDQQIPSILPLSTSSLSITTLTGRTLIWEVVVTIFKQNPILGYGPHLWDPEMTLQWADYLKWTPSQSHNQYIQVLGESGILGLISFLMYGAMLIYHAWKARNVGKGIGFIASLSWFVRGVTEAWFRGATADGNLFIHSMILALVILSVEESKRI